MTVLVMMRGLPASGKSTEAKRMVAADGNYVRVNRDELRLMLHGDAPWSQKREKRTVIARNLLISGALAAGHNVVSDDTNLAPSVEADLRSLAREAGATFQVIDFTDVPLATCLERDAKRAHPVGEKVIKRMYDDYLRPKPPTPRRDLPRAVIVDMDGTLALLGDRGPYEDQFADRDLPNTPVIEVINAMHDGGDIIIVMSGRDEGRSRKVTEWWLDEHGVHYDHLFMRAAGDTRKDSIVKRELHDEHVKDRFTVNVVLDDRDQVVEMWRKDLGYNTFQVNYGDF